MSDIVEMLEQGTERGNLTPVGELCVAAADEIKRLRQRVRELEEKTAWHNDREERARCMHCGGVIFELAELRKGQGEPYLYYDPDTYQISRVKPNRPTYLPLYTSPPVVAQGEPVYYEITLSDGTRFVAANRSILEGAKSKPLYTTPTIPEGWQLVPIEPTEDMIFMGQPDELGYGQTVDVYKNMLTAAPKLENK